MKLQARESIFQQTTLKITLPKQWMCLQGSFATKSELLSAFQISVACFLLKTQRQGGKVGG